MKHNSTFLTSESYSTKQGLRFGEVISKRTNIADVIQAEIKAQIPKTSLITNEPPPAPVLPQFDAESLASALQIAIERQKKQDAPQTLNMKRAAAYIGRSVKGLEAIIYRTHKKGCRHPIPFHQPLGKGSGIYFDRDELGKWLKGC